MEAVTGTMAFPMSEVSSPDSKVLIRTITDDSDNTETLWATSLGNDLYRLDNSPFFAYDVSWEDIVLAPPQTEHNYPHFEKVIKKSGNRTIRVFFDSPLEAGSESSEVNAKLNDFGCYYEGISTRFVSYNIPPDIDLQQVVALLEGQPLEWEYGDPSYNTLHSSLPEKTKLKSWISKIFRR